MDPAAGKAVFLFPLVFSLLAAVFLILHGDYGWFGKLLAISLSAGSVVVLFATQAHFLVPLFMQLSVCIWFVFDRKLNG